MTHAQPTTASTRLEVEYGRVDELRGPLLVIRGVSGVGWDEFATIRTTKTGTRTDDPAVRHGLVLEVDGDLAIVQVLEGTDGLARGRTRVSFSGAPLRVPVGAGRLGRVCNGRGDPIDGGPPITAPTSAAVAGNPLNPTRRDPPAEPVLTGISAIDALTTLVRGQKLPIFSVAGLPHLELAAQIAAQPTAGSEPFSVVFAGMGLTHADAGAVRAALEERSAAGELLLLLNTADDPVIERIMTPRIALTIAEHLAFEPERHVLVVLADMTSYAEAPREVSAARGELPGRRAYPGYLYSDLAAQLLAALDRARRARQLAEIVSAAALNPTDRLYLSFADTFEQRLINQHRGERRSLDDTLDRCWDVANVLPARELTMLPQRFLDAHPAPTPTSP